MLRARVRQDIRSRMCVGGRRCEDDMYNCEDDVYNCEDDDVVRTTFYKDVVVRTIDIEDVRLGTVGLS